MSDVTPLDTLNTPKTPQNTPQMTITNFNYEGSYLPGVMCNIVAKADLGKSPGRSTPSTDILWSRMAIGRSASRTTPHQLSIDALNTTTPNTAHSS